MRKRGLPVNATWEPGGSKQRLGDPAVRETTSVPGGPVKTVQTGSQGGYARSAEPELVVRDIVAPICWGHPRPCLARNCQSSKEAPCGKKREEPHPSVAG
jgi:hypothetical protein